MALRIKIPFVLDLAIVRDDAEMTRLNNEPAIVRHVTGKGGLLHRLIRARIESLPVGKGLLPAFERRDNPARHAAQQKTEQELTRLAKEAQPFDRGAIARLARFVVGDDLEQPVGVTVQEVIGRMLDPDYKATEASYAAARDVAAVFSSCPVAALRVLWWKVTARLVLSRALIWHLGRYNPTQIHATAIAMHNVVDSLKRMRTAMKTDVWDTPPAQAAAWALAAPSRVMRACTAGLGGRDGLRDGTMIWFKLRKIHRDTENNDLAFSRHQWSQCPAHAIIPRLLEEVWATAVRERATQRYVRRPSLLSRLLAAPVIKAVMWLNRRRPWYRLGWWPLAFVNLAIVRKVLRERNLYDSGLLPSAGVPGLPPLTTDVRRWRTADGSYNDLNDPNMGRAGTRFGRNVPLAYTYPDDKNLLVPSPRDVSRYLLARGDRMIEQEGLNVLAAAWIQFQVHDWFSHTNDPDREHDIRIDPAGNDPWPSRWRPMMVSRTLADPTRPDKGAAGPPTYLNKVTHWWDASQLYGSDQARQRAVREGVGGRLRLVPSDNGDTPRLPRAKRGEEGFVPDIEKTGVTDNWWLGLSLFHQLFTLEHNAICERLKAEFPQWDDEQLFQTARLVNAALITKIHDLEWVPLVLANKPVQKGLYVSWWGILGKWVATRLGRLPNSEMLSGIPGSATDHHAAPYAITEEFVSVYRMHAFMMPDELPVLDVTNGGWRYAMRVRDILGGGAGDAITKFRFDNLFYSFGRALPGQLTLGNYSTVFQQLVVQPPPGAGQAPIPPIDLATIDILRDRERGVPRYNEFRRLLHLPPITSFRELSEQWEGKLRQVYGTAPDGSDRVDLVDLLVGMLAEKKPDKFGFSDTTFRIFVLMNSRRMKSDRFYTTDYTAAVYTQAGIDWVANNDLRSVLLRHYPSLAPALQGVPNVFGPWRDVRR